MSRKKLSSKIENEIFTKSKRRCCICFALNDDLAVKRGQIAHTDHNAQNDDLDNLAFLCLEHHDQYDSQTSQSKNFTMHEIKEYRDRLYKFFMSGYIPFEDVTILDPLAPLSELPKEQFSSEIMSGFKKNIMEFVISDQIPESGGWSLSQERIFQYNYGSPSSKIDKREGGIISTYMAARALRACGSTLNTYSTPGKAAAGYLLKRRTGRGAFGRFSASRSGE